MKKTMKAIKAEFKKNSLRIGGINIKELIKLIDQFNIKTDVAVHALVRHTKRQKHKTVTTNDIWTLKGTLELIL